MANIVPQLRKEQCEYRQYRLHAYKDSIKFLSYSVLRLPTGLASADLMAWKLMVNNVIIIIAMPEIINTLMPIDTR